jgi:two-component system, chemotaxis family, sensor kinase Cph1
VGVTAADISACDREPIHIPGTIQPHGILLALDPKDLTVTQAAGDTERLLGVGHANLIGNNLGTILGSESLEQIRAIITDAPAVPWPMFGFETVIERPGKIIEAIVHVSDGIVVLELEPLVGAAIANPLSLVQGIIMRLQHRLELDAFLQGIAEEVRAATGFERVMIYKFLPDDSGAVVAESRGTNIGPYLGLHYPASDIPKQARALYLRNWLRLIPDARYTPAPIVPAINPLTNKPLDLSHSALRSVSPVHLEYLANMGVTASMSLSLVVEGRLWGLIACHDREPKHLPHSLRAACELLAQLISLQLADKLAKSEQAELLRTKIVHAKLVEALLSKETLAAALIEGEPNVNDYIPSSGALVWWDGKISRRGDTPNDAEVAGLVDWLNRDTGGVLVTDCLAKNYPPAAAFAEKASGLIALSISRSPRDYVLWFRREVLATVHWAGDPNKPVEPGQGDRLNPRSSFAAWKEIVRGCSDAWPDYARDLAEALRSSILEVVLRWMDEVCQRTRQDAGAPGLSPRRTRSSRKEHARDHPVFGQIFGLEGREP